MLNQNFDVISIIGDGAISAGLAYEGLNNLGHLNKNSLIILNDNEMSIAEPVGAMSKYLVKLLSSKSYESFRDIIKNFTKRLPNEVGDFAKKTEGYLKGYLTLILHLILFSHVLKMNLSYGLNYISFF